MVFQQSPRYANSGARAVIFAYAERYGQSSTLAWPYCLSGMNICTCFLIRFPDRKCASFARKIPRYFKICPNELIFTILDPLILPEKKVCRKKHTRSLFLKTISNIPITKCSSRACFFLRWKMYLHYRYDRLRELTKVAKLLLPFSHVIIRAVNWNCARECICIEQRPINPIILWFFNHSSSIRWLPRQIELTKIPVLASSKIQPDLPAG